LTPPSGSTAYRDGALGRLTPGTVSLLRGCCKAEAAVDRFEWARGRVVSALADVQDDLPAELKRLEEQFKENEVDVLRIFQGRQSPIQNRRAVLDMLNELAQATAAVTATTGIFPRALVSTAAATHQDR
jgi:hypothetical protein